MKVALWARTTITPELRSQLPPSPTPHTEAEHLVEAAGRSCYESWSRPNAATAATRDYIKSAAIDKGHGSILEHASVTFYITGITRSCTHELVRHRHLSYSQLSQRYVDQATAEFITPPALLELLQHENPGITQEQADANFRGDGAAVAILKAYRSIHGRLTAFGTKGKRARQAARAVMPECTETKITVTGNLRAWRHFVLTRGTEHADDEIRLLALELLDQLYDEAPAVFGDIPVTTLPDGRLVVEP